MKCPGPVTSTSARRSAKNSSGLTNAITDDVVSRRPRPGLLCQSSNQSEPLLPRPILCLSFEKPSLRIVIHRHGNYLIGGQNLKPLIEKLELGSIAVNLRRCAKA